MKKDILERLSKIIENEMNNKRNDIDFNIKILEDACKEIVKLRQKVNIEDTYIGGGYNVDGRKIRKL